MPAHRGGEGGAAACLSRWSVAHANGGASWCVQVGCQSLGRKGRAGRVRTGRGAGALGDVVDLAEAWAFSNKRAIMAALGLTEQSATARHRFHWHHDLHVNVLGAWDGMSHVQGYAVAVAVALASFFTGR